MIVGRLLLRFLLVPLGGLAALVAASSLAIFAHWSRFAAQVAADPAYSDDAVMFVLLFAPIFVVVLTAAAVSVLMPATLGVLIAEAFAIRSWLFHVGNGVVSAAVGWLMLNDWQQPNDVYQTPVVVLGAGIVAGFAYWAVAGWNAGFWKPVFAPQAPPVPRPPAA